LNEGLTAERRQADDAATATAAQCTGNLWAAGGCDEAFGDLAGAGGTCGQNLETAALWPSTLSMTVFD